MPYELTLEDRPCRRTRTDFVSGWDWERVTDKWVQRIQEFGLTLDTVFKDVHVHDPESPSGRTPALSWWPRSRVHERHMHVQRHFDHAPGTYGPVHPYQGNRRGQEQSLEYLWEAQNSPRLVSAILIAASLFPRIHARKRIYPEECWPKISRVMDFDTLVRDQLYDDPQLFFGGWHHSCTQVLPFQSEDGCSQVSSAEDLIRYLGQEHASLLHSFQPVRIVYASQRDPIVAKDLNTEYQKTRNRSRER